MNEIWQVATRDTEPEWFDLKADALARVDALVDAGKVPVCVVVPVWDEREREIHRRNLATIQHEIETPLRDHDADGACCRAAAWGEREGPPLPLDALRPRTEQPDPSGAMSGDGDDEGMGMTG